MGVKSGQNGKKGEKYRKHNLNNYWKTVMLITIKKTVILITIKKSFLIKEIVVILSLFRTVFLWGILI